MKNLIKNKKIRISLWILVGTLTGIGSLPNYEGGPWPFYIKKTGKTMGISFCCVTKYPPGTSHVGLNISLVTIQNEDTKITGGNISILNVEKHSGEERDVPLYPKDTARAVVNGLEFGLVNYNNNGRPYKEEFLLTESIKEMNGLQIGLLGSDADLVGMQIGLMNFDYGAYFQKKTGVLINIDNEHSYKPGR